MYNMIVGFDKHNIAHYSVCDDNGIIRAVLPVALCGNEDIIAVTHTSIYNQDVEECLRSSISGRPINVKSVDEDDVKEFFNRAMVEELLYWADTEEHAYYMQSWLNILIDCGYKI